MIGATHHFVHNKFVLRHHAIKFLFDLQLKGQNLMDQL